MARSLSPILLLLEVLWFQVLRLSLESILSWFLSMASDMSPVSFFCTWLSSFLNTTYWRDYLFPAVQYNGWQFFRFST